MLPDRMDEGDSSLGAEMKDQPSSPAAPRPLASIGQEVPRFILGDRELVFVDAWPVNNAEAMLCILSPSGVPLKTTPDTLRGCTSVLLLQDGVFKDLLTVVAPDGRSVECKLTGERRSVLFFM